jgi:hypothetical protein
MAAWPSIPDQIKAAVKAVVAPYLAKGIHSVDAPYIGEGGCE